jgi:hypothetical protein
MNTTLTYDIAKARQNDLLRESAHRRLAAQAKGSRGDSVWTRLLQRQAAHRSS